ncbi:MAG TPA: GPR endopeptidase [Clostridiales bacterium]|jgi:spore protease|nr:GPR endopeptidase [Clostridiales bacterium]
MKTQRTDLAMEVHELLKEKNKPMDGIISTEETIGHSKVTTIKIENEQGETCAGKPQGTYYTLDIGQVWMDDAEDYREKVMALKEIIARSIQKYPDTGCAFVAGLGNRAITADSVGPNAVSHIIVTRHIREARPELFTNLGFSEIAAISPGVLGETGIESAEVLSCIANRIKPKFLVVIDALASRRISRLATTIQISDSGINPGSGVGNNRPAIDQKHLGLPVISIGVPTVVDAATLALDAMETFNEKKGENMDLPDYGEMKSLLDEDALNLFVTPKETDRIIDTVSTLIAYGLNLALHPGMDYDEMLALLA